VLTLATIAKRYTDLDQWKCIYTDHNMLPLKKVARKNGKKAGKTLNCKSKTPKSLLRFPSGSPKRMTPKRLRKFKGFEKIKTREAKFVIRSLEAYSELILCQLKNNHLTSDSETLKSDGYEKQSA